MVLIPLASLCSAALLEYHVLNDTTLLYGTTGTSRRVLGSTVTLEGCISLSSQQNGKACVKCALLVFDLESVYSNVLCSTSSLQQLSLLGMTKLFQGGQRNASNAQTVYSHHVIVRDTTLALVHRLRLLHRRVLLHPLP
jgi:hypothetical protein